MDLKYMNIKLQEKQAVPFWTIEFNKHAETQN